MNRKTIAKIELISSCSIFGTIGVIRKFIPLPSGRVVLLRAVIGVSVLLLIMLIGKRKPDIPSIKKDFPHLFISASSMAINWVLFFESFNYTSVAVATLCYYMSPVFVILASPFVLKERLSLKNTVCVAVALAGMVFVSGVFDVSISQEELYGIALAVAAACFYAVVVLENRKMKYVGGYDKTVIQLFIAMLLFIPYSLLEEKTDCTLTWQIVALVLTLGIVQTGLAYAAYFDCMKYLSTQSIALFAYLDPLVAILLSATVLHESMNTLQIAGAVLILGSAIFNELSLKKVSGK